jgi:hypothetical protein
VKFTDGVLRSILTISGIVEVVYQELNIGILLEISSSLSDGFDLHSIILSISSLLWDDSIFIPYHCVFDRNVFDW